MLRQIAAAITFGALLGAGAVLSGVAEADEVEVEMHMISETGIGKAIGKIRAYDSENGLVLSVQLTGLPVGPHGFHLHENGDCGPAERDGQMAAGLAAGGHYDPEGTGKHLGPSGEGHKGDLPVIYVEAQESALETIVRRVKVAPRLTVADMRGRSLVIHSSGDNYRDEPSPLGGGGSRIACGVVP